MDRILHPGHHEEKNTLSQDKDTHHTPHGDEPKKEGEVDKFKDYIKKDERMEEGGRTYNDLL